MPIATVPSETLGPSSTSMTLALPNATSVTHNLLALSQDVTALVSLSFEATASLAHDIYQRLLARLGLSRAVVRAQQPSRSKVRGEAGRGMAVVVVGASEAGQTLTLMLAKTGYTVFPLVPLPSPSSPPTSAPLSSLLLRWSTIQKRLRARIPNHPGTVVPLITDPHGEQSERRYAHTGETIQAYCRENGLVLTAVVCTASPAPAKTQALAKVLQPAPVWGMVKKARFLEQPNGDTASPYFPDPESFPPLSPSVRAAEESPPISPDKLAAISSRFFKSADEQTLMELYRSTILEPLAVVKELSQQLASSSHGGQSRGRVIFVNGHSEMDGELGFADKVIGAARSEAARLLRDELEDGGIDVCEVIVGPLASRAIRKAAYHLRRTSDESNDSDEGRQKLLKEDEESVNGDHDVGSVLQNPQDVFDRRVALISRIWAVDDALLFSAVRRAIEDRHPRYRHHAGLSPILASISEITPGSGIVKMLGRWIVGRLLMPRTIKGRLSASGHMVECESGA